MNELAITGEKLDLIKRTVAKGASDEELELFLYTCKRTGLDPLTRQIYCIKRGGQMTTMTGIDGYRAIADRTGKYAGNDDPIFDSEQKPRRATVTVYKLVEGVRCPFTSTARWDQYYPGKSPLWDKMPHLMLGKCAEALALRKAFPQDLSGLYTKEEMDQADVAAQPTQRQYALKPSVDETLPQDKFIANKFPASEEANRGSRPPSTTGTSRGAPTSSQDTAAPESSLEWKGVIQDVVKHQGENAKGPWTLFRINMEDGNTATTFDEARAKDAEIMIGQEVRVLIEANKRKPGTFTYLGFEPIPQPETGALWPEEPKEPTPF
jgi:phage recombination protein Bet